MRSLILCLTISILTVVSCKKDKDTPETQVPPAVSGVYATYSTGSQWYERTAFQWENASETTLLDEGKTIYTNGVDISPNGDIYVAGCECKTMYILSSQITDDCQIVLWKNKVKQVLTETPFTGVTPGLVRVNTSGEAIVIGTENNASGDKAVIRMWKNGVKQNVSDGTMDAEASDMALSGNDVYVVGYQRPVSSSNNDRVAVLWKNGIAQILSAPADLMYATAVAVSGSDVYVALHGLGSSLSLLKNGSPMTLPGDISVINDLFVVNDDVYMVGGTSLPKRGVWKNGQLLHELTYTEPNTGISVESVYVSNGDVYAAGIVTKNGPKVGVIWKNGVVTNTLGSFDTPSYTTHIGGITVR